jgi:PAS domain S-box-containing protein
MKSASTVEPARLLEKALLVLHDGICIVKKDGTLCYINTTARDILHRISKKLPVAGDRLLDFIVPERTELNREAIAKAFRNEFSFFVADHSCCGTETWYEIEFYPMPEANDNIDHVCIRLKNITERIQLEKKLQKERKDQKNKVIKATIEAQENERSMIGRELHDNVNQVLTTVKLYTEICYHDDKPNRELLGRSIQQVNYCIEEIRNLSRRLAVPKLGESGLEELIKDLVDTINSTRKTSIQFLSHGIRNREFSQELQTTIYRIVQEQLTNVLKYAYARSVKVVIGCADDDIAVQVQDDGIGFDLNEKRNGNGITNMISRAETIGGTLNFETSPGNGCIMTAEFPLIGD